MPTLVVTGGASGIGNAVARSFRERGWDVVIADVDGDAARDAAALIGSGCVELDVSDAESVDRGFREVADANGGIDALVTSAGITRIGASAELDEGDWRRVIDIDLTGTFLACRCAARHMWDGGGSIVTIASIAAFRAFAERAAYSAAKAGVVSLTRVLAVEWAGQGIRVNCVAPGWVDTPFLRDAARKGHVDLDELAARAPLGGLVQLDDVVGAIRFLLSDEARFVTGQTLCVDGGWVWSG